MISLERILKHMSWANQEIFSNVCKLEDKALQAFISDPNWNVGEILFHITDSAGWYVYRLTNLLAEQLVAPKNMAELTELTNKLKSYDSKLLALAAEPDSDVILKRAEGDLKRKRSTILSQSVHHATEHRAQAIAALEFAGYKAINLDDYDLWSYEHLNG
jgi:uncharacterized damage-inducible protein DinB